MDISIFLPVRKGSQRIPNKNSREFGVHEGGLLELKLKQLIEVREITEIVVSTNDEKCFEITSEFQRKYSKVRIVKRPDVLGSSETDLGDLINHVPEIIHTNHILWTHVTSPFCHAGIYTGAIEKYFSLIPLLGDSLVSGRKYQEFLMDPIEKKLINCEGISWPRTQDLRSLFELNNAIFITSRECYLNQKNRIGFNPYLFEMDKISSLDIDEEVDFKIAEAIYEKHFR